jgi:hypothetical protein
VLFCPLIYSLSWRWRAVDFVVAFHHTFSGYFSMRGSWRCISYFVIITKVRMHTASCPTLLGLPLLGRILLPPNLHLRLAAATLVFRNGIHHAWHVLATAPPSAPFCPGVSPGSVPRVVTTGVLVTLGHCAPNTARDRKPAKERGRRQSVGWERKVVCWDLRQQGQVAFMHMVV